jgi:hypothetical protein
MSSESMSTCFSNNSFSLERTRFFPRQLIAPDDLTQDQVYFREKLRRHNRLLHGWGIVCGAQVEPGQQDCEVIIKPGYVLGPYGDEIYIERDITVDLCQEGVDGNVLSPCGANLDPWCSNVQVDRPTGQPLYLAICHAECQTRPVRVAGMGCGCNELECEYSRIQDSYVIKVLTKLPSTYTNLKPAPDPDTILRCAGGQDDRPCPDCPTEPWVILADITLGGDNKVTAANIDRYTHRRYVASFANFYFLCQPSLPTIRTVYPANASSTSGSFLENSFIEISFDRKMKEEQLRNTDPWLRVWQVFFIDQNDYLVKRSQVSYQGAATVPQRGEKDLTIQYRIDPPTEPFPGAGRRSTRYILQIRPLENGVANITDNQIPPGVLDADFQGTNLSPTFLDQLWNVVDFNALINPGEWQLDDMWQQLVDTKKSLPSGDGKVEGYFHGWFNGLELDR